MGKTKAAVDEFKIAFLPFQRMLDAVQELEPVLSKEQAVGELDKAINARKQELEELVVATEATRLRLIELNSQSGVEAENILHAAKERAKSLTESASRKASALENDALEKVRAFEDAVLELEARAESARQEARAAVKQTEEEAARLNQIKQAIARLTSE